MKLRFVFFAIIVFLVSIFFFWHTNNMVDYQEIPFFVSVGDHLGFNVDTNALFFGTLQKGSYAFRSLVITNEKCGDCFVNIQIDKSFQNWIYLSEDSFRLRKGEFKEIIVYLVVSDDANLGEYSGKLHIYFKKAI